ncbi:hypothetical protein FANTH_13384 [Fusarium anthophilum]|uniref:Transcription factor n=1 Tax=Fusarium anthophilum TaxID=48485 RepID=A0A8H5DQ11_9HYPO|nr:hypothetical protein FANTH_13384 [Fusarium anthophilum]
MTAQGSPEGSSRLNGDSQCDFEPMPFAQELALDSDLPWGLNVPSLPLFPPFVLDSAPDVMLGLEQLDPKDIEFSSGRLSEPGLSFLSLEQLDPLQAKCGAIQALLQAPGPELPEDVVTRNFQHHIPILHAPTFNLATASPLLVLAMFTAGACYTDIVRPAKYISAMAIRALANVEQHPDLSQSSRLDSLDRQVASDFSGPNIVRLAARVACLGNSSNFDSVNRVLDQWPAVWERRTWRDTDYENLAFSLDPLPFWWLAKLSVLLHCGRDCFSVGSEFTIVNKTGGSFRDSYSSQVKIFRWLGKLRQKKSPDQTQKVESLASLMPPM